MPENYENDERYCLKNTSVKLTPLPSFDTISYLRRTCLSISSDISRILTIKADVTPNIYLHSYWSINHEMPVGRGTSHRFLIRFCRCRVSMSGSGADQGAESESPLRVTSPGHESGSEESRRAPAPPTAARRENSYRDHQTTRPPAHHDDNFKVGL